MKIIFMGTSDFAVATLQKLMENSNHQIVAVYTKEPSSAKRGMKTQYSPIHILAEKNNLPIFTPKTLKDIAIQQQFAQLNSDIAVVISYGLILPSSILKAPKYGCFNVHPSKLPLYRGSAPIQRSIIDNVKNSAVCVIKMDEGVDSGDIVNQQDFIINDDENYQDITKKTAIIGAQLINKTLINITENKLIFIKQSHELASFAKKIDKAESLINWDKSSQEIINLVRAFNGNIYAHFNYENQKIRILKAFSIPLKPYQNAICNGTIIDDNFSIKCSDGIILPQILQKSGKNPLYLKDFLNGFVVKINLNLQSQN